MTDTAAPSPDTARSRRFVVATILFACALVAVGLTATEFALRMFGPRETNYYILRPHLRVESDPDSVLLPGISGRAHFSVNSIGLRGDEVPQGDSVYRILVVGGSTSENVYLDDQETWPHILQTQIGRQPSAQRVWAAAAARGGMNVRDHVVQVERVLETIPPLDRMIFLVGVNDLTVALAQGDTFRAPPPLSDPAARLAQERRAFAVLPGALHENLGIPTNTPWHKRTALWQLGVRVRAAFVARSGRRDLQQDTRALSVQRWRDARAHATKLRDSLPPLTAALAEYRHNLETIVALGEAKGVPVSFLSQPSLWRADLDSNDTRLLWFGGLGDFQRAQVEEYYSPAALARAMSIFNAELLDVCEAHGLRCLDLAVMIPRSKAYFVDDVHFTERGSAAVGEAVAVWLAPTITPKVAPTSRP